MKIEIAFLINLISRCLMIPNDNEFVGWGDSNLGGKYLLSDKYFGYKSMLFQELLLENAFTYH